MTWNYDMSAAPKKDAPPFESRGPLVILGGLEWSHTGWWNGEQWVIDYDGGSEGEGYIYPPTDPFAWQPFPGPPSPPLHDHHESEERHD